MASVLPPSLPPPGLLRGLDFVCPQNVPGEEPRADARLGWHHYLNVPNKTKKRRGLITENRKLVLLAYNYLKSFSR